MNIFGIVASSFLFSVLFLLIWLLIVVVFSWGDTPPYGALIGGFVSAIVIWLATIFIWIGVDTQNERIYVEKFNAQKTTIERSLESDILSGAERLELVNKAVDLNGEFAEKKAKFDIWYYVYYDESIYDNVEHIVFDKEKEE